MSAILAAPGAASAPPSARAELLRTLAERRLVLAALGVCAALVVMALAAPWIAPHDPSEQFRDALLSPPLWSGGSWRFPLGTDDLGRDMLSRLIHGARVSLLVGALSVLMSLIPGVVLGLVAAFHPGAIGVAIMRVMDVLLALPGLLLAVAVVAVLGPGLYNTMVAIAIVMLPLFVRLARATAASELPKDYVTASRIAGAGPWRLMFDTVLPNCAAPLIVQATLGFSAAIMEAAALGFLGLGAQPPTPEWGTMLSSSREFLEQAPWVVTLPGLAILVTVLSINLLGDSLRDALDPRLKRLV